MQKSLVALIVGASLGAPQAFAADPAAIVGKWVEKFPNGSGLVTEFTSSAIISYPIDKTGASTDTPSKSIVQYRDTGPSNIAVDFDGGGMIQVEVQSPDQILLHIPNEGAHQMTKL
jgi:hypothetical protein